VTQNIFNTGRGWAFLGCIAVCIGMIGVALAWWGAKEVREEGGERFFLTLAGTIYLLICVFLFKWMGIGLREDVVERKNTGALLTLCAATIAVALIYCGGSTGEGLFYMENVFSVGLALVGFFIIWILLEVGAKISVSIAEERDLASGIRAGGFLLAVGLILARAVAGDWHSASATVHDYIRDGWPAAVVFGVALVAELLMRPNRHLRVPPWPVFGLVPALLYLAIAGGWLRHVGAWEGMPR
jgi:hypothetical protein